MTGHVAEGWFDAFGHPVSQWQRLEAVNLLVDNGYDRAQACLVVAVIAREVEHDEPQRAHAYARRFVYEDHPDGKRHSDETLVIRLLATIAAPNDGTLTDDLRELLGELR